MSLVIEGMIVVARYTSVACNITPPANAMDLIPLLPVSSAAHPVFSFVISITGVKVRNKPNNFLVYYFNNINAKVAANKA